MQLPRTPEESLAAYFLLMPCMALHSARRGRIAVQLKLPDGPFTSLFAINARHVPRLPDLGVFKSIPGGLWEKKCAF